MLETILRRLVPATLLILFITVVPLFAQSSTTYLTDEERLQRGEVIVGMKEIGPSKFITGTVLINEPPERVWPIMVNPFEFLGKISPRMKQLEVVTDQAELSVLKVTLDVVLIPHFTYVVESKYENGARVSFRRISGILKDFKGAWEVSPAEGGSKTALTYSMYIDPGFPLPQWIVREGVKSELPRTLLALRTRVNAVYERAQALEPRTILAAAISRANSNHRAIAAPLENATQ
jgi:hypothetical protein